MQGEQAYSKSKAPIETGFQTKGNVHTIMSKNFN